MGSILYGLNKKSGGKNLDELKNSADKNPSDTRFADLIKYLKENDVFHYIFNNSPENVENHNITECYVNNVYRAYNYGATKAKGKYLIFLSVNIAY